MKKKPSFNDLLLIVNEILEMAQNPQGKEKKDIPPSALVSLDILEIMVPELNKQLEQTFKNSNVELEGATQKFIDSQTTDEKNKEIVRKAMDIEKDAKILQAAYTKSLKQKKQKKKTNSREKKERKKLFKPLGGDKKWIPL